ncbi:MAG: hypothetical protein QNJ70_31335 [Xenococcaceae cyanobacterium MO_207.B15]|nr:hypothetical protein [Xenococcaceae cyanobacterium MO_207.B15]
MGKGFGKSEKKKTAVDSLSTQLRYYAKIKRYSPKEVVIFQTSKKRFVPLGYAVNQVANEYPELYFKIFLNEGQPAVIIAEKGEEEYDSYCWVSQSSLTNKWLVMARPPGAEEPRSLSVWKDFEKAKVISQELEPKIRSFPLKDWQQQLLSPLYVELLKSLPDDDDEVVGIVDRTNGLQIIIPENEDGAGDRIIDL